MTSHSTSCSTSSSPASSWPSPPAICERQILTDADARRSGGTWQLHVDTPIEVVGRDVTYDDGEWRWTGDGDPVDANVVASGGFIRATFTGERTPVGPSVGQRSVDFWRFADVDLGTGIGPLTAPIDVTERFLVDCGSLSGPKHASESLRSCGRRRSSTPL